MRISFRHIIAPILFSLCSCTMIEQDSESSMGYLAAPSFDVDLTIDTFVQTKAAPQLPELHTPTLTEVTFKVTDKDNRVVWNQKGIWSGFLKMPVGAYKIEATSGENAWNEPVYAGSYSGTIAPVTEDRPKVELSLKNAVLAVGLAEDLKPHFIPAQNSPLKLSSTSGNIAVQTENYVFVPSGEDITIAIEGESSAGVAKTLSYRIGPLATGTATFIECGMTTVNAPSITVESVGAEDIWGGNVYLGAVLQNISAENQAKLKFYASDDNWISQVESPDRIITDLKPGATYKIRAGIGALMSENEVEVTIGSAEAGGISKDNQAVHTVTGNDLDGTDFKASFIVAQKFMSELVSMTFQLCNSEGTVIRSFTGNPSDDPAAPLTWDSDGSADALWPYLPTGNGQKYSVKGYAALKSGKTIMLASEPLMVPPPVLSTGISAETTYDMYLARDIDRANSLDADTIYDIRVTGISEALKKHSGYGYNHGITINGEPFTGVEGAGMKTMKWTAYTIASDGTFDGQPLRHTEKTCHITGLPYRAAPPTNKGDHPWTEDQTNWGVEYFNWNETEVEFYVDNLTGSTVIIGSPELHIFSDINIQANVSSKGKEMNIICGDKKYTHTLTDAYTTYSDNFVLNANNKKIQIENTKLRGWNRLYVNSVEILYR